MKAVWDWSFPRTSEKDEEDLVAFSKELGFDTIVINGPSRALKKAAANCGIKLIAVIHPAANGELAQTHPECIQQMMPFEVSHLSALEAEPAERAARRAHRWYPYLQQGELLCYDQQPSLDHILKSATDMLEVSDGIALDGFGYKNHYACFCKHCVDRYGTTDPEKIADGARKTLIDCSKIIYDHAKSVQPDCTVINHVWPPFEPDPYYGCDLYLDYCTQTISWFYKPEWSLEHVEFEAAEHRRLQKTERNQFVPFIGFFNEPYHRRTPARIADELDIGLNYGSGSLVFSTLQGPMEDNDLKEVLQDHLQRK